jgi:nitrile hydratase accessory protein
MWVSCSSHLDYPPRMTRRNQFLASGEIEALPALPRDEGGPVFAEPWQAQAFALAVKLSGEGHFTWKEWTVALTDELNAAAARGEPDLDGSHYYHHWLAALERLVVDKGLADEPALSARKDAWEDAYRHTPHGSPVELGSRSFRQLVVRADGRPVEVVQRRAHVSYCLNGCCCGRTDRGYAAVPAETFKDEWLRRKLRKTVHLTKAGCLGPCALANVASLMFDGRSIWFHSVNTPSQVRLIFDYIEMMIDANAFLPPPTELAGYAFNFYDWERRGVSEGRLADEKTPAGAALPLAVR